MLITQGYGLEALIAGTYIIDTMFKKLGIKPTYNLDVIFAQAAALTQLYDVDVLYEKLGITKTDTIDTIFKKLKVSKTDSIDVLFKKFGVLKTDSLDVIFKKFGITAIDSIDVLLKKLRATKTYSVDVLFKKFGVIETDSIDVVFKKLGITKTDSIDTLLKKLNITVTDLIDTLFALRNIRTDQVDVVFKKLGISRTTSIDVCIKSLAPITIGRITAVKDAMLEIIALADSQLEPQEIHVRGDWKTADYYLENNYPVVLLRLGNETIPERIYGREITKIERGHYATYAFSIHVWAEKEYQLFDDNGDEIVAQAKPASVLADEIIKYFVKYRGDDESGIVYFYDIISRESEPERGPQRLTRIIIDGFILVKRPIGILF